MTNELTDAQLRELRRLKLSPRGLSPDGGHHKRTLESLVRKKFAELREYKYYANTNGVARVHDGGTRSRSGRP